MIGYMPDFFGVYDQLKADEYLDFYAASYGISESERKKIIPQLLELVNLTHKRYEYVDLLSRGMKQRLCLARSLIHDPKVLILDEPASGLDPRARIEMRDILKSLKNMGKTILISSHILPELAEMCDEIGVIDNGRIIAHGSVNEIQTQLRGEKVITVHMTASIEQQTIHFFEENPFITNIKKLEVDNGLSFSFKGTDEDQVELLKNAMVNDIPILSFTEHVTNLEDVFMEITKGANKMKLNLNNPVLSKEIKLRFRSPKSFSGILFYLIVMCIFVFGFIFVTMSVNQTTYFTPDESFFLFTLLSFIQLGLVLFISPGLTAGVISTEREKQTLPILLTTSQSSFQIIIG